MIIIVMTGVGLVFGFILAIANKKFSIEVDPKIHEVEDILPKGQCGACGFAGCAAYADAVVSNPDVAPNLCVPGKEAVAKMVAEITGKAAASVEPKVAHIKCSGSIDKSSLSYKYKGVKDCFAANLLQGGPKDCKFGCIGFGTCVQNCPFDAMTLGENGLPIVDTDMCTGCGSCAAVCPKKVIEMISPNAPVKVNCNSNDKGAAARKFCSVSCLGCGICKKNCNFGAITIENNLAIVDTSICTSECTEATCTAKCPTGAIKSAVIEQNKKANREAAAGLSE